MKKRLEENYYSRQLNSLETQSEYQTTVQFTDPNGGKTKYLSLNKESIPEIIEWLRKLEENL